MDFVWLAAVAVLWVIVAEMVVGLNKLAEPKQKQKQKQKQKNELDRGEHK